MIGYRIDGGAGAVLAAGRERLVDGVARASGERSVRVVGDAVVAARGDPRAVDAVFRRVTAVVDDAHGDGADGGRDPVDRLATAAAAALRPRRLDATAVVAAPTDAGDDADANGREGDRVGLRRVDADGTVEPTDRVAVGTPPAIDDRLRSVDLDPDATVDAVARAVRSALATVVAPVDVLAIRPGTVERVTTPTPDRDADSTGTPDPTPDRVD